jgi:hypothetical protein
VSVHLESPWARAAVTPDERRAAEAMLDVPLHVSVSGDRRYWCLYFGAYGGSPLKVSRRLSFIEAVRFGMEHAA